MIKVVKYLLVIVILGVTSPAFAAPQWMTMIELPTLTYQIDQETVGITRTEDDRQLDVWINGGQETGYGRQTHNYAAV